MIKKYTWPVLGLITMTVLTTIQAATVDGSNIDAQEWVQVGLQGVMAFNVWATANLPQYERMKTWVAIVIVVMQGLVTYVIGGVSTAEIINLVIAALAAAGVALTPQALTRVIDGQTVPPNGNIA